MCRIDMFKSIIISTAVLLLAATLLVLPAGRAEASEISWVEDPANPVYDPADHRAYYPCVLYDPNQFSGHGSSYYYKMWYGGYPTGHYEGVTYSDDGVNWTAPVEMQGISANGYHAKVLYIPGGFGAGPYYYKMWYWNATMTYSINDLRTADSTDGVNWVNDQVLTQDAACPLVTGIWPDWNRGSYGPVAMLYNTSASNTGGDPFDYSFTMYYDGTTGGQEVIGLGYSADGNHWYRYGNDPVLDHGSPGDWDSDYATNGSVIPNVNGEWHMWYSGSGPSGGGNQGIGYATSPNGINWTKDPDNPIMHISDGVAWRNVRTYTPSVLYSSTQFDGHGDGTYFKMWFSGRTNTPSTNYSVGYATSLDPSLSLGKTSDPSDQVEPGQEITYTLTLSNQGGGSALNTVLTDTVPDYTTYAADSTTLNGSAVPDVGGTTPLQSGMSVNSPGEAAGVLAPGGQAVVTFKVIVDPNAEEGKKIVNQAIATCDNIPDPTTAQKVNTVYIPGPQLSFEKRALPSGTVQRGSVIIYTLRVRNDGNAPATGCLIMDAAPTYTGYVRHTTTLNGILVPDVGDTTPLESGIAVNSVGEPEGEISPGEEAVVTFRVQAGSDLPVGSEVRNVATLQADGMAPEEVSFINPSAGELPTTWYFAEGSTQPGFDEYLLLTNLGGNDITATVTYITGSGTEQSFQHIVPANSRRTIVAGSEMPGEASLAAIVQGTEGLICERSMYFQHNGISGGHDVIGANAPSVELYLAEGFTGNEGSPFEEWILLLNPGLEVASLEIDYLFPGGETFLQEYKLSARSRLSINVDQVVGEGREVSAHIRSDNPVVAERAMYFIYNGMYPGGHCENAVTGALSDWYLAEGFTGWEGSPFDEWILVANQNDQECAVTVTYMFPDGSTEVVDHTAAPNSRLTISADAEVGQDKEISAHVHADLPVVVERAMYFDYRNSWPGGHDTNGATAPAADIFFAEGYTGNPSSQFETWLLIQNTADEAKAAQVEYILWGGESVFQDIELPPHSRSTIYANQVLEQGSLEFSMRVTSKDGSPCLLAERAMYFDYTGSFGNCTGGHDVVGY